MSENVPEHKFSWQTTLWKTLRGALEGVVALVLPIIVAELSKPGVIEQLMKDSPEFIPFVVGAVALIKGGINLYKNYGK